MFGLSFYGKGMGWDCLIWAVHVARMEIYKCMQSFVWILYKTHVFGENSIETHIREIGHESVGWIELVQDIGLVLQEKDSHFTKFFISLSFIRTRFLYFAQTLISFTVNKIYNHFNAKQDVFLEIPDKCGNGN